LLTVKQRLFLRPGEGRQLTAAARRMKQVVTGDEEAWQHLTENVHVRKETMA